MTAGHELVAGDIAPAGRFCPKPLHVLIFITLHIEYDGMQGRIAWRRRDHDTAGLFVSSGVHVVWACRRTPRARATFKMVAKLGLPFALSAL